MDYRKKFVNLNLGLAGGLRSSRFGSLGLPELLCFCLHDFSVFFFSSEKESLDGCAPSISLTDLDLDKDEGRKSIGDCEGVVGVVGVRGVVGVGGPEGVE